jgi:hypothetical protein
MGLKGRHPMAMNVPRIGQQPRQISITPEDTIERVCGCGCGIFHTEYRIRVLPRVSPKNPTDKDQLLKIEVYLCEKCGKELGSDEPDHAEAESHEG